MRTLRNDLVRHLLSGLFDWPMGKDQAKRREEKRRHLSRLFHIMAMLRLRFHASWLPADHSQFWTVIDHSRKIETVYDLLEYFNEQQKSLAEHYEFHLPKRSTKLKYMKAFVNECVLPPQAQALEILRDNDQIE